MPPRVALIIHERRGNWSRQLRPRVVALPLKVVETRSETDLLAAVAATPAPLLVFDPGRRVAEGLDLLDRALGRAPDALCLVLDPIGSPAVGLLARELGASHVLPATTPPPEVFALVSRWARLAARRAERSGWMPNAPDPADADPLRLAAD